VTTYQIHFPDTDGSPRLLELGLEPEASQQALYMAAGVPWLRLYRAVDGITRELLAAWQDGVPVSVEVEG